MKILHLVPSYLPAYRYGGPIWSVHALNKWLIKKGVDVTVYTTNIDGKKNLDVPTNQEVNIDSVKVYYWPISFRPWQYSAELRRRLNRNIQRFDLIHITSVFLSASTIGAYYSRRLKRPYVISPRGSLMKEPLKKGSLKKKIYLAFIEKRNLAGASAIHFTSEEERKDYLKEQLPLRSSIVIPNGFDPTECNVETPSGLFRKKLGITQSKKIILFLSRISWKKGLDTLIPAFALVKKKYPDAILVIAGGDDKGYRKMLDQMIKENNLMVDKDVFFTGMITGEYKAAAYKESDVFVLPSYGENFGMVVVEAMYFGLPVVMTNTIGTATVVRESGAGLIVGKNESEVAEAILEILNNPNAKKIMGEKGKMVVKDKYAWPAIADQFIEEYSKILKGK